MSQIELMHPIAVGTTVEVMKPSCSCANPTYSKVVGKVAKVIKNNSGTWYYLDIRVTVRAKDVSRIVALPD